MKHAVALSLAAALALNPLAANASPAPLPRPPQYVLLAFDGSLNLDFWEESYDFAEANNVKFTYFISGVYFLMDQYKAAYTEPTHGVGRSGIGWGGKDARKIRSRVDWVNKAYDHGHEIGSHANGHYDGSTWTLQNWRDEFRQFTNLIFNVFRLNKISESGANPFHFEPEEVKGFRAPLLGRNAAMDQVLREKNFKYDTSRTAPTNYWPEKLDTVWNFPLAQVRIAGTGKRTLSMDYNFYYAQSAGLPQPAKYAEFKKEMFDTYMQYFTSNYNGNRAPVNIGHHFSKWNGGAYWDAMKDFAKEVCALPEVKCVTYKEYTQYLESLPSTTLAQYRKGNFDHSNLPEASQRLAVTAKDRTLQADAQVITSAGSVLKADVVGPQAQMVKDSSKVTYEWSLDGRKVSESPNAQIDLKPLGANVIEGSQIKLSVKYSGREILASTHTMGAKPIVSTVLNLKKQLSAQPLELRALQGDLPEAHHED